MKTFSAVFAGIALFGGVVSASESSNDSNDIANHKIPELTFGDAFQPSITLPGAPNSSVESVWALFRLPSSRARETDPAFAIEPRRDIDAKLIAKKPDARYDYKLHVIDPRRGSELRRQR